MLLTEGFHPQISLKSRVLNQKLGSLNKKQAVLQQKNKCQLFFGQNHISSPSKIGTKTPEDTLPETNIAPEKLPSQKKTTCSIPTIHFSRAMLNFGAVLEIQSTPVVHEPPASSNLQHKMFQETPQPQSSSEWAWQTSPWRKWQKMSTVKHAYQNLDWHFFN